MINNKTLLQCLLIVSRHAFLKVHSWISILISGPFSAFVILIRIYSISAPRVANPRAHENMPAFDVRNGVANIRAMLSLTPEPSMPPIYRMPRDQYRHERQSTRLWSLAHQIVRCAILSINSNTLRQLWVFLLAGESLSRQLNGVRVWAGQVR